MFGWDAWIDLARKGNPQAFAIACSLLADALQRNDISPAQRAYLAEAFAALAKSGTKNRRREVVHRMLLLERGRGRPATGDDKRLAMATAVWDLVGNAKGAKLERALYQVAIEIGLGRRGNTAPDLRRIRKAFIDYLPVFLEIQRLGREDPDILSDP